MLVYYRSSVKVVDVLCAACRVSTHATWHSAWHTTWHTTGHATCTACTLSTASTVEQVLAETRESDVSERGASRADDKTSEAAMEDRKRGGYF